MSKEICPAKSKTCDFKLVYIQVCFNIYICNMLKQSYV